MKSAIIFSLAALISNTTYSDESLAKFSEEVRSSPACQLVESDFVNRTEDYLCVWDKGHSLTVVIPMLPVQKNGD